MFSELERAESQTGINAYVLFLMNLAKTAVPAEHQEPAFSLLESKGIFLSVLIRDGSGP